MVRLDIRSLRAILNVKWRKKLLRYFSNDEMLFFMHIPKTAGTSFRYGAEEFFGKDYVDYDYGVDSPVTTGQISKYFYAGTPDPWSYLSSCSERKIRMVGGHVSIEKYVALLGVDRTITFIRDPLQRIASEFAHVVQYQEFRGSFRDFYTRSYMKNVISRYFRNVDLEAFGFVGLSERYEESLNAINEVYRLGILFREDNRGRSEGVSLHDMTNEEEEELRQINRKDIELYHYCKSLLDVRLKLMQENLPYTYARMNIKKGKIIDGWAWWEGNCKAPVEIEVIVNGDVKATVRASDLREDLCYLRPPRGGYVGFHYPVNLRENDLVQCRVSKTNQLFPPEPVVVKHS